MDRHLKLLMIAFLAIAAGLGACGDASPITIEQVSVYPNAEPVEPGNVMAETISGAIRENANAEAVDVEVRIYTLSPETPWEVVEAYYTSEFGSGDWSGAEELDNDSDYVNTAGWKRGGLSSEQAVLVGHSIDPLGGRPFLILMLFTE